MSTITDVLELQTKVASLEASRTLLLDACRVMLTILATPENLSSQSPAVQAQWKAEHTRLSGLIQQELTLLGGPK